MGMPYRGGQRPVISQVADTLIGVDRGDFFTQEGSRPERTAWQWEYEDGAVGSGRWIPLQPFGPHDKKREEWGIVLGAESMSRLQIGAEWVGRRFRLQTWAGFGPSVDGDKVWCEWGNSDGSHADDLRPSSNSYSEPWVVKAWGVTIPPDTQPKPLNARQTIDTVVPILESWVDRQPGSAENTRINRAIQVLKLPEIGLKVRLGAIGEIVKVDEE